MTGNDDTGSTGPGGRCCPPTARNAERGRHQPGADARPRAATSAPRDGWTDLAADHDMDWTYDATDARATSCRPGGCQVNGLADHQQFTVAIGFGSTTRPRAVRRAQASLGTGFAVARAAYDAGWAAISGRSIRHRAGERRAGTTEWNVSAMVLAASEDKTVPRWLRRRSRPPVGLGELAAGPRRLPRGLVARPLPDRDRAARGRRQGARRTGRWTTCGACSSGPTARSRRTRGSTGRRCSATCRWTRSPSRSCSPTSSAAPVARRLGAREEVGRLRRRARPETPQERWENASGYSPATIAAEIAGLVCAADIATQER